MAKINAKSKEQYLQDLIRKIRTNTDLTDFNPGGQLVTLLEAVSTELMKHDFDLLRTLEMRDLDNLTREQLIDYAKDIQLPDQRGGVGAIPAMKSVGSVTFSDESFDKIDSFFYSGKPAPFAGSTKIYIEDAELFPDTGSVYLGVGTEREEGPIEYTDKTQFGGYWYINLSTPTLFDHPYSDSVLLSQGGIRTIPAGTRVFSSTTPAVYFRTDRDVKIIDGETQIDCPITAVDVGSSGNIEAGKVANVESISGVSVTNELKTYGGRDVETRSSLLNRIKKWQRTLSKSTLPALINSLEGLSNETDTIDNVSSVDQIAGEALKLFINNTSLLEPEFKYFSKEILSENTSGKQKTFVLKNKPVAPPFLLSNEGNFRISEGQEITILADGKSYVFRIDLEYYKSDLAKPYEIVNNFNSQHTEVFDWRVSHSGKRIVVTTKDRFERIECIEGDLQETLGFPVNERRSVYVYVDGVLQNFNETRAELETNVFSEWDLASYSTDFFDCQIKIDGVLISFTVDSTDFNGYGTSFTTASAQQWAEVLQSKIPGCESFIRDNRLVLQSTGKNGTLELIGGNWIATDAIFSPYEQMESEGETQDYVFNRYTGQIRFLEPIPQFSKITVSTADTRAQILSEQGNEGSFDISTDSIFVHPYMVVCDDDIIRRDLTPTSASRVSITLDAPNDVMIFTDTVDENIFVNAQSGDFMVFNADQDANPPASRFGTTGAWEDLNGVYKVLRVKRVDGINTEVHVSVDDTQQSTVSDLITDMVVTSGMFTFFSTEGNVEDFVLDTGIYNVDTLCEEINSKTTRFKCTPVDGNQIRIFSKKYTTNTITIVSSFADANEVFLQGSGDKTVADHVAFSESSKMNLIPRFEEIIEKDGYYSSQSYIKFGVNNYDISNEVSTFDLVDYPLSNQIIGLNTQNGVVNSYSTSKVAPFTGVATEHVTEHSYIESVTFKGDVDNVVYSAENANNYISSFIFGSGLWVSDSCNLTYKVPNSVKVPLQKRYQITEIVEPGIYEKGSIVSFKLKDPEDLTNESDLTSGRPIFDVYHPLRKSTLEGCKIATRSIGFLEKNGSAVVVKSSEYSKKNRIRVGYEISTEENSSLSVKHAYEYNPEDNIVDLHVIALMGTGAVKPLGKMDSGTYSVTWGTVTNGVADVEFSSETVETHAVSTTPVGDMIFQAQTAGEVGNGIVVNVVDTAALASVSSGFTGLTYQATSTGTDGNGIAIEVIDSGSGGLAISEDTGLKTATIDLGGDDNVTRLKLQQYTPAITQITYEGSGFSQSLAATGVQVTSGGTGSGLSVSEDVFNKIVTVDLGGDTVSVIDLQDYIVLNPITLINVLGNSGTLTEFNATLSGGSLASNGSLENFTVGDVLSVSGIDSGLPVGAWVIESKIDGTLTCKIPYYNGASDLTSVNAYDNPLKSFTLTEPSLGDIETAFSSYGDETGLFETSSVGLNVLGETLTNSIWVDSPVSGYTSRVDTLSEAKSWHSTKGCSGGEASIYSYDPDDTIKAIIDSGFSLFPSTEYGTAPYTIVDEDILVMPDNTFSLGLWYNTHIHTTIGSFCDNDCTENRLIVSSRDLGSDSVIKVESSPSTSSFESPLLSDAIESNGVGSFETTDQFSRTWLPESMVKIIDKKETAQPLPYGGGQIFDNNRALYIRDTVNLKKARIVFLRRGQFDDKIPESLVAGDEVTFSDLGNGLVKIEHSGSGRFDARVGEMLFVPNLFDTFPSDIECKSLGNKELITTQPTIISPVNGDSLVSSLFIQATVFKPVPSFQTHVFSDWQVLDDGDNVVWESLGDPNNLTSIEIPDGVLPTGVTLKVRVRYYASTSGYSLWSYANEFTLQEFTVSQPSVIYPENNDTNIDRTVEMKFSEFDPLPEEQTHVSTDIIIKDVNNQIIFASYDDNVNKTSFKVPRDWLDLNSVYFVQIRYKSDKAVSNWSDDVTFSTTDGLIVAPVIINPINGAVDVNYPPTITLSSFVAKPEGQEHVSTSWRLYEDGVVIYSSLNDTVNKRSWQIPSNQIELGKTYSVDALFTGGVSGDSSWSNKTVFTVVDARVDKPSLVSPFNGQTDVALEPTIVGSSFSSVPAQSHIGTYLEIYSDANMENLVYSVQNTSTPISTVVPPEYLEVFEDYFVRIKYEGSIVDSEWSDLVQFVTTEGSISAPSVTYPSNGSTGISLTPTLTTSSFNSTIPQDHTGTSWYLYSNSSLESELWSSVANSTDKTSITVPSGVLSNDMTVWAAATHIGSVNGETEVGAASRFDTIVTPPPPPPPPPVTFGYNTFVVRKNDGTAEVYDIVDGVPRFIQTLNDVTGNTAVSADGTKIAHVSGSNYKQIKLLKWNGSSFVQYPNVQVSLSTNDGYVDSLAFNGSASTIVVSEYRADSSQAQVYTFSINWTTDIASNPVTLINTVGTNGLIGVRPFGDFVTGARLGAYSGDLAVINANTGDWLSTLYDEELGSGAWDRIWSSLSKNGVIVTRSSSLVDYVSLLDPSTGLLTESIATSPFAVAVGVFPYPISSSPDQRYILMSAGDGSSQFVLDTVQLKKTDILSVLSTTSTLVSAGGVNYVVNADPTSVSLTPVMSNGNQVYFGDKRIVSLQSSGFILEVTAK